MHLINSSQKKIKGISISIENHAIYSTMIVYCTFTEEWLIFIAMVYTYEELNNNTIILRYYYVDIILRV